MREWQTQPHVKWYCRYHIVIVPKYRKKSIFGVLRKDVGNILKAQCRQFRVELIEGHAMPDHIHLCLSIPPRHSVAYTIGRLKGKSAVIIHRDYIKVKEMPRDSTFGQRVIASVPLVWMKKRYGRIYATKRKKIVGKNSWI